MRRGAGKKAIMANKRQLRVIARNLIAINALESEVAVFTSVLNDSDIAKLDKEIKRVAYSLLKRCYKSKEYDVDKIIKDVLANVE